MRRNPGGGRGLPDLARPIGTAKEERTKLLDSVSGLAGRWAPLSSRPCLPSCWRNTNSRAPSLRGRYPASPLLRAHPPPSRLRPTSRGVRLYGRACSAAFAGGARRASPVTRHVLVTVPSLPPRRSGSPRQPTCDDPCGLRLTTEGSASGVFILSGPPMRSLSLRPGDSLTIPRMAFVNGLQDIRFPSCLPFELRGVGCYPGGADSH